MNNCLVVIPTYNEVENIESLIFNIFLLYNDIHILVVDDSSPDGTSQVVTHLQDKYKNQLFLEIRQVKNGLGRAYIHGFKWALSHHYDYIFEMDADFSHNPKDLEKLYETCKDADIAIGSRYIKGINVVNWPLKRILLSYGASWYVRLITNMKIYDPTAGFICYRRHVLQTINLSEITFTGYAFQIEMKYKAYIRKFRLIEIPIIFKDRQKGYSKMNKDIILEAVFGVIKMRIKALKNKE